MPQAFAQQALADARGVQDVDALVLEHARAHAMLDVVAALRFEHDGVDAAQVQQLREQQARPGRRR